MSASDRHDQPMNDSAIPEPILQAAIAWTIRLDDPTIDDAELACFSQWLEQSDAHAQAFHLASDTWQGGEVAEVAHLLLAAGGISHLPRRPRARPHWRKGMMGLAASLLLVIGGLWQSDLPLRWQSDTWAGVGKREEVRLADGTKVLLNTQSGLAAHLSPSVRDARLTKGEAFFDVARDAGRPFVLRVGKERVRVLGTAFNVRYREGRLQVSVREGHVEVENAAGHFEHLLAGQALSIGPDGALRRLPTSASDFAWVDGRLSFENQPLREVLDELGYYYSGLIVPLDDDVLDLPVSGNYRMDDPQRVLASLAEILGIRLRNLGPWVILLG
ncbi:FecR family protein [Pseudomonas sp. ABC1]|uniref:FecR family protein n=1 Tax=Pseudomonas sp. ABC1 TaxID=2748080 RepID=UPI0015C34B3E|nr:FecR family protein [Pseudomonas sp. ABC1]QLF93550.1 FecR family protein [Pseudomonas sp. ABC1]